MKNSIEALLAGQENVLFAYLFGSYARGDYAKNSDVDIAVYLSDTTLDERLRIQHILEVDLNKNVDLLLLNEIKNIYLLENVLKEGILLKDHEDRALFEVEKNLSIIDFKNFKRYIDAA